MAGNPEGNQALDDYGIRASGEGPGDDPVTVKALAEKLGIEARDIYEELEIPLGDDKTTTLGEWKDRVKALQDIDGERETVQQLKADYERNLMATRAELNALLQVIPPELRENMLGQARERSTAWETQQRDQVFEAIPDWKEPDKLAADRAAIVTMGSEYGFSEPEITYTQDARTVRMLHDFLRLRERVEAMETAAKRKPGEPNRTPAGKKRTGSRKLAQAIREAKESRDPRNQEAVISQLIRNQ
jgi:hypothetical protein